MIERLVANIDALGDRIHPIVVLMLRKQGFWKSWCPVVVGTHIALLVIVWFGEPLVHHFGPQICIFGEGYLRFLLILPTLMPFGSAVNGYPFIQKKDPLLLLTPLSDRSIWLGFYLDGLYHGLCAWCYVVLTYSYCYAMKWVPLEYVLFYPLFSLLAGCLYTTLGVSMNVAAKTVVHRFFIFPIWFFPLWCLMMLFVQPPQVQSRMLSLLFRVIPSSLLEPVCWIPVLAVATVAYLFAAWKLFHFNLVRRRPFIVKYFVSLFVYLTLTALLAAFWYGLWYCLIGV